MLERELKLEKSQFDENVKEDPDLLDTPLATSLLITESQNLGSEILWRVNSNPVFNIKYYASVFLFFFLLLCFLQLLISCLVICLFDLYFV